MVYQYVLVKLAEQVYVWAVGSEEMEVWELLVTYIFLLATVEKEQDGLIAKHTVKMFLPIMQTIIYYVNITQDIDLCWI